MLLLYWLIFIMPLEEHSFWGMELFHTLTIPKLLGIACVAAALMRIAISGKAPQLFYARQAPWYGALLAIQLASYFVPGRHLMFGVMAYSHVLSIAGLFIVVLAMVDSEARLYRTLLIAIAGMGFASLYAIRQAQKYGSFGFRSSAMFQDSNEYALLADLWLPLAFLWMVSSRPKWERFLCFICFCSILLGSTFASSRGGLLGLAAAILLIIWRSHSRVKKFLTIGVILVPLMVLLPVSALRRLRHPGYSDVIAEQARTIVWKAGLRMIAQHPIAGVGLHNFKPLVGQYEPDGEEVISLAHNTYIEIAAELGIPGLLAFLGVLAVSFRSLELSRRKAFAIQATHLASVLLGLEAGLVSFIVSAFFVTVWWEKLVWLLLFTSMASNRLVDARLRRQRRDTPQDRRTVAIPDRLPAQEWQAGEKAYTVSGCSAHSIAIVETRGNL